jgi:regulator of replication initiation timing
MLASRMWMESSIQDLVRIRDSIATDLQTTKASLYSSLLEEEIFALENQFLRKSLTFYNYNKKKKDNKMKNLLRKKDEPEPGKPQESIKKKRNRPG